MKTCLAVNTATTRLSVALLSGGAVAYLFEAEEMRDQGNILMAQIRAALDAGGLDYADLDLLAAVTGPGSFTGIRIGLAALRGIGLAAGVPVAGVSSFDMFAVAGETNLVAVESWREELYFRQTGPDGEILLPPVSAAAADIALRVTGPVVLSGDAAEKTLPFFPGAVLHAGAANAADVARIALSRGRGDAPAPFYVRDADISQPKAK